MESNKDLLKEIRKGQEDMAKSHYNFASSVSIFMNEQKNFNTEQKLLNAKVIGYLENDDKTNHIGGMQQISDNKKDIALLKNQRKVAWGVVTVLGVIGGFILKAIGFFKT